MKYSVQTKQEQDALLLTIQKGSTTKIPVQLPMDVPHITVVYEENAHADLLYFVLPGQQIRQTITIKFLGNGSGGQILGVILGSGVDMLKTKIHIEHIGKATTADILIKGVLTGTAYAHLEGLLRVQQGAKQTDTYYRSDFLLLSKDARVVTIPSLEIIENDLVRGGHAVTVSNVDAEQLFYLRSRGIEKAEATNLLVHGYLNQVVQCIQEGIERVRYESMLSEALILTYN